MAHTYRISYFKTVITASYHSNCLSFYIWLTVISWRKTHSSAPLFSSFFCGLNTWSGLWLTMEPGKMTMPMFEMWKRSTVTRKTTLVTKVFLDCCPLPCLPRKPGLTYLYYRSAPVHRRRSRSNLEASVAYSRARVPRPRPSTAVFAANPGTGCRCTITRWI